MNFLCPSLLLLTPIISSVFIPVAENVELIVIDAPDIFLANDSSSIPIPILIPVALGHDLPERPFLDYTIVIKKILIGTIGVLITAILLIVFLVANV